MEMASRAVWKQIQAMVGVAILLLASRSAALAQKPSAGVSPKIGLVLEGGGALGLAHVGVITWLEEHHIPVNYVAGASMGALVGGLYATGRSPSEVRELVSSVPWNTVLRGEVPFARLNYRRKEDDYQYPGSIEFGLNKAGIQLPSGFNSGQEVQFILDRVALPYSTMQSFDDLPIPFGCVATDLLTKKPYIFRSGSLATALRSTMSLPGIFAPVHADGQIFADGGLLDNLPVDVAQQMGADLILAVHLETQPMEATETPSAFGVLGRSISVMIAANEMRSIEKADVLVSVPLNKFGPMEYGNADAIIKAGYDAAEAKANILSKLSVDEPTWQRYLAERTARRRQAPVPQFVEIAGTDPRSAKAIAKSFDPVIGKPIDNSLIQNKILEIQGDGRYSSLDYTMVEKDSEPGLLIHADEKTYAPHIVRPQITLDGSQYNNVLFSLGGRITFINAGGYGSELRNDVVVGSEYALRSEYYHPLRVGSKWFVAPRGILDSSEYNAYTDSGNLASIYRVRQEGGGIDFGYITGRSGQVRVGYEASNVRYSLQVGEKTEPIVAGREGFSRLQYTLLHTDDPVVPTTGQFVNFRTQWFDSYPSPSKLLTIPGFPLTEGKLTQFVPVNDRTTITLAGAVGTVYTTDTTSIGLPVFSLGGPTTFAAYGTNEILSNQYFEAQVGFLRELKELPPLIGDKLYLQGRFDIGRFQQVGTALGQPNQYRVPGDIAAGVLVNTKFWTGGRRRRRW